MLRSAEDLNNFVPGSTGILFTSAYLDLHRRYMLGKIPNMRKSIRLPILGSAVFLCATQSGLAQKPPQDLQQLKAQLQQVEEKVQQLVEVTRTLRGEIAAAEQARTPPGTPLPVAPSGPARIPPPQLQHPNYIGKETRQRQTVSEFPEEAPRIDNEELDPTLRGFFRIPGTQTLVKFADL